MANYRRFEVIAEQIHHPSQELTLNQALAIVMLEISVLRDSQEKLHLSLVVCQLEYIRVHRLYTAPMGKDLYRLLWDIWNEKSKYEQILDLGVYLKKTLKERNHSMSPAEYESVAVTVAGYFQLRPEGYQNQLHQFLYRKKPKAASEEEPPAPTEEAIPVMAISSLQSPQKASVPRRIWRKLRRATRKLSMGNK